MMRLHHNEDETYVTNNKNALNYDFIRATSHTQFAQQRIQKFKVPIRTARPTDRHWE